MLSIEDGNSLPCLGIEDISNIIRRMQGSRCNEGEWQMKAYRTADFQSVAQITRRIRRLSEKRVMDAR